VQVAQGPGIPADIAFPWFPDPHQPLTPVHTFGYAHGAHYVRGEPKVIQRAFAGHIVSAPDELEIPARPGSPFAAFELSFVPPPGLSGAPLLSGDYRSLRGQRVAGMIVGNNTTAIQTYQSKERIEETRETTIVERYDTLYLGVAVQAASNLQMSSAMLGGTVAEFLAARQRLVVR